MSPEHNLDYVNERLTQLLSILQYDTEEHQYFKVWERISINQERASLMDIKNYLHRELDYNQVRFISVPESIEIKIQAILKLIGLLKWKPKYDEYEY